MKKNYFLISALEVLATSQYIGNYAVAMEEFFASVNKESDNFAIFQTDQSKLPPGTPDYDGIDLKFKDTYILRLGSSPTRKTYLFYEKPDNSFKAWSSGKYASFLAQLGLPLKNVVHSSLIEEHNDCFTKSYTPKIEYGFDPTNPATLGSISHIIANFNFPLFKEASYSLLQKLGSPEPAFDFIVTDEKTTKFITTKSGLYNIISLLKVGGLAVLTHLDEEYKWQYEKDAMTPKMSDKEWDLYNLNQKLIKSDYEIPLYGLDEDEAQKLFETLSSENVLCENERLLFLGLADDPDCANFRCSNAGKTFLVRMFSTPDANHFSVNGMEFGAHIVDFSVNFVLHQDLNLNKIFRFLLLLGNPNILSVAEYEKRNVTTSEINDLIPLLNVNKKFRIEQRRWHKDPAALFKRMLIIKRVK